MGKCYDSEDVKIDPCHPPQPTCRSTSPGGSGKAAGLADGASRMTGQRQAALAAATQSVCRSKSPLAARSADCPLAWFDNMIENCLAYASQAKANGRRVVGIMCEYTPRELIMAAEAVPVCLCGGSAQMIGPAEEHLPANLCPLIKSTYGFHLQKENPFLEMADLVVAETTCDGKKKMYELMAETRPMYVLELPQKPDDSDALAHWISELRKLKARLEEAFGVQITDEKIRQAVKTMNRERALRRQLAELMKSEHPPLTGRQLLQLKSSISGLCADFAQYERALEMYRSKEQVGRGLPHHEPVSTEKSVGQAPPYNSDRRASVPARLEKSCEDTRPTNSKVRVLMTGVPMAHGAERVIEIIESQGGLVVCMDNCTGLKPILEDVDESAADPILALAQKYFRLPCSVMTPNDRRLDVLRDLARQYKAQCVIDLIWQACITYDVESHLVKRLAENELGLPYLRIETDYSPSDSARIALRVEALFETIRQRTDA